MTMTKKPDRIGFYWEAKEGEPAEIVWVEYIPFLIAITHKAQGDPIDNAHIFDRALSHTLGVLTQNTVPT